MPSSTYAKAPTVVEMFAGGGGAALGLHEAGFRSLAAIDMWGPAVETLRAVGFPVVEGRVEDEAVVREVDRRMRAVRRLDLLWASPPCQPYSSSGLRLGNLDPRDGWSATVMYILRYKPRAVLIENVSDAPVEEWARLIQESGRFKHAGSFHLRAQEFGMGQDRPRAFVYAGEWSFERFMREVDRHRSPARSVSELLPHLGAYKFVRLEQTTAVGRPTAQPCATATTKGNIYFHKNDPGRREVGYRRDPDKSRRATVEEMAVLQGFPADYPFQRTKTDAYKIIGNAVAPPVARALGLAVRAMLKETA